MVRERRKDEREGQGRATRREKSRGREGREWERRGEEEDFGVFPHVQICHYTTDKVGKLRTPQGRIKEEGSLG